MLHKKISGGDQVTPEPVIFCYCWGRGEQGPEGPFSFFNFLGLHLQHIEVPRLGVESERQLPAYTTATPDLSHICKITLQLAAMLDP